MFHKNHDENKLVVMFQEGVSEIKQEGLIGDQVVQGLLLGQRLPLPSRIQNYDDDACSVGNDEQAGEVGDRLLSAELLLLGPASKDNSVKPNSDGCACTHVCFQAACSLIPMRAATVTPIKISIPVSWWKGRTNLRISMAKPG